MSGDCGCGADQKFDGTSPAYKRILIVIIVINLGMFFVELFGGLAAGSMALLADSLDFLGDSATYTISLIVIGMPLAVRAKAGLFKGISLFAIAAWVLGSTFYRVFIEGVPEALTMGAIGVAAFAAIFSAVNTCQSLVLVSTLGWRMASMVGCQVSFEFSSVETIMFRMLGASFEILSYSCCADKVSAQIIRASLTSVESSTLVFAIIASWLSGGATLRSNLCATSGLLLHTEFV